MDPLNRHARRCLQCGDPYDERLCLIGGRLAFELMVQAGFY